jgi:hypothetical protein
MQFCAGPETELKDHKLEILDVICDAQWYMITTACVVVKWLLLFVALNNHWLPTFCVFPEKTVH